MELSHCRFWSRQGWNFTLKAETAWDSARRRKNVLEAPLPKSLPSLIILVIAQPSSDHSEAAFALHITMSSSYSFCETDLKSLISDSGYTIKIPLLMQPRMSKPFCMGISTHTHTHTHTHEPTPADFEESEVTKRK